MERDWGINASLLVGSKMDATVVYMDYGISSGMELGIDQADHEGRPIQYRKIGKNPEVKK